MKESFRHFEHNKTVDLIGLGNAIVDIIVNIEDEFLEINNLDKAVSYTHLTLPTNREV